MGAHDHICPVGGVRAYAQKRIGLDCQIAAAKFANGRNHGLAWLAVQHKVAAAKIHIAGQNFGIARKRDVRASFQEIDL